MVSRSVQITAFSRFLLVIMLGGPIHLYIFYQQTGRMVVIIFRFFSAHHTVTHRENNQLAAIRKTCAFTALWALKSKHFEHTPLRSLDLCVRVCVCWRRMVYMCPNMHVGVWRQSCVCINFCTFHVSAGQEIPY